MADESDAPRRDLRDGVALTELDGGRIVAGQVDDDDVIVLARDGELFAIGAHCSHYHGPLADGLVVDDTVRCPWHHACFSLRTGEALRAPALDPVGCWHVERVGDRAVIGDKIAAPQAVRSAGSTDSRSSSPSSSESSAMPSSIVVVGGGAAGLAAADMLRREGYAGTLTMLSADDSPPCDRPNLSKDFLAGTAPDDWIPLRAPDYYAERKIDLMLGARVAAIDTGQCRVTLEGGKQYAYDALLLATGADPVRLDIAGAEPSRLHYLRTFADSRAIVAAAGTAKRAIVVGTSFIGLEVAASLRARGIDVHVVGPDRVPLERVMGAEVGHFIRTLHESQGVTFHMQATVQRMDGDRATLSDSTTLVADLVVLGVGVRPSLALAEQAGLALERGVSVDKYLQTSAPGVYAAGDIARWPDPHSGERIRVEHWVVAERQGQVAAKNMLGQRVACDAVPFFWSQHYDVAINYVGHAESFDAVAIDGSLAGRDCKVTYTRGGRALAVATIGRDMVSLKAERAMEVSAPVVV
jgi:NADPH-dependent 2,4-dienoyl-CoA reductase/sulfur reductase-like enzyme/nitrite reductase/ring-hydroxylating ferredoxin subunit